ncbi:hypothetical protein [Longimicrobium sp.]|uniref:hypothetical protein n=1 Tax=Longimicrobium sp. TaxID=2029185 RepID=UPI002E305363|nr:hypothetical protein [Longimicrobium sp.]HEX6038825.1 hypothetical protein [Longimicrobium sp.]
MTCPVPARVAVCVWLCVISAACGERMDARADAAPRDSAGIRIVESARPVWDASAGWRVDSVPALQIGSVEGAAEYQLGRVQGAARLAGGGVAVADANAVEVRFYDARGRFLRAAGRRGGGPGEFGSIDAMLPYRGDSLAVWDARQTRLVVLGPDGGVGRTTSVRVGGASAALRGILADGSFVLEPSPSVEAFLRMEAGERRDSVRYVRHTADGAAANTLDARAGRELVARRAGGALSQESVLFGRNAYFAASGEHAFVGESDAFRVDVTDAVGRVRMSIRRLGAPRRVERADLARAREAAQARQRERAERIARVTGGAARAPAFDDLPARATMPAFDQLAVDAEQNLWVRDYQVAPDDPSRWSVFDPRGRWLGTVETPAGLTVLQIGADWILGRARDELEVEYVRLYRLRKG